MPFRYGIAAMTALPHVVVSLDLAVDGQLSRGVAADGLAPKWFTKDPATALCDDVADMLRVIGAACTLAQELAPAPTVFDLWHQLYTAQMQWAAGTSYPPLLWGFGVSLVERAMIDAFCRATQTPFADAVRRNTLGIRLGVLSDELAWVRPAGLLPRQALDSLIVRHTVGLADPVTDSDIAPAARIDDGLPQSLEACISAYGLTHFKIKLSGNAARDVERLKGLARVIAAVPHCAITLDGNEQYGTVTGFRELWHALEDDATLGPLMSRLLFVEQPLDRAIALSSTTREALRAWDARPPIIVDESDDSIGSLAAALACGYAGTSCKSSKGVFRGIANACLLAYRRRADPAGVYIHSGEDLATVGPIALQQDLAVMATLGITHVERNGHHYFTGLRMLPEDVQGRVLAEHGDLYHRHDRGFATLTIRQGRIAVGSLVAAPFGLAFVMDTAGFTPAHAWNCASLDEP
jgi:hypothetical protein